MSDFHWIAIGHRQLPSWRIGNGIVIVNRIVRIIPAVIPVRPERGIPIVRHVPKLTESVRIFRWMKIPDQIFHPMPTCRFGENIVVPDRFLNRVVFIPKRHVDESFDVALRGGLVYVVANVVKILRKLRRARRLVALVHFTILLPVGSLIKIPLGQIASIEEIFSLGQFESLVEPPKVTVGSVIFVSITHHAKVHIGGLRHRHTLQPPKFRTHFIRQPEIIRALVAE